MDDVEGDIREKSVVLFDGKSIIGCTTVNKANLWVEDTKITYYLQGNTIINGQYRGKGLSKFLYSPYSNYSNWLTLGFTDLAWKIQPKFVKCFTPIKPVNVYVAVNFKILGLPLMYFLAKRFYLDEGHKQRINITSREYLELLKDPEDFKKHFSERWFPQKTEIERNAEYIRKRFFEIYCADKYKFYLYYSQEYVVGYVVLRTIKYRKIPMVSIVDYRFVSRNDELKVIKAASRFASSLGIGLVLFLTSREYNASFYPLFFKTGKKLKCAIGSKGYQGKFEDLLVTAADSDLDFVYYE